MLAPNKGIVLHQDMAEKQKGNKKEFYEPELEQGTDSFSTNQLSHQPTHSSEADINPFKGGVPMT